MLIKANLGADLDKLQAINAGMVQDFYIQNHDWVYRKLRSHDSDLFVQFALTGEKSVEFSISDQTGFEHLPNYSSLTV